MKNHLCKFVFAFLLLLFSKGSFAQSAIMDSRITWVPASGGQYSGKLSVFLTDTSEILGERIIIGSAAGDSDLYQVSYTIGQGGNFPPSSMLANSELKTNIGTYSSHPDYYATISILLSNGKKNQISIHSSN